MGNKAVYTAEYLDDGHLSIPDEMKKRFTLKSGMKVRVIIEEPEFSKVGFLLSLCGIWKKSNEDDIAVFKEIYGERCKFGRGEVKL